MNKIFLDTDVILDVLIKRKPHFAASKCILGMAELSEVEGTTSSLVIANLYYLLAKLKNKKFAKDCVRKLMMLLEVLEVDGKIITQALESEFGDFEDAVQYFSAKRAGVKTIVTRNLKHYKRAKISVMSPDQFLAGMEGS